MNKIRLNSISFYLNNNFHHICCTWPQRVTQPWFTIVSINVIEFQFLTDYWNEYLLSAPLKTFFSHFNHSNSKHNLFNFKLNPLYTQYLFEIQRWMFGIKMSIFEIERKNVNFKYHSLNIYIYSSNFKVFSLKIKELSFKKSFKFNSWALKCKT